MKTIIIIGAGFSGTVVAVNLLRLAKGGMLNVHLIESSPVFARGLAYSTWDDNHLLNVPAGNLSALVEDPDHFVRYCRTLDPELGPSSFVPRRIYGDYLERLLADTEKAVLNSLIRHQCEAIAVDTSDTQQVVRLANDLVIIADFIVLALGHDLPKHPIQDDKLLSSPQYINNPWNEAELSRVSNNEPVLLIGTSHTAIDILCRLSCCPRNAPIYMVSRHGLLPHGHWIVDKSSLKLEDLPYVNLKRPTVRELIRVLRNYIRSENLDWRDAIQQLRSYTPTIWNKLNLTERKRFLRHLLPFWDIHRHRLAPIMKARLEDLRSCGRVKTIAGKILSCSIENDCLQLIIQERGSGTLLYLDVATIINCTGPNYDIEMSEQPLIKWLIKTGQVQSDSLKLGMNVSDQYEVISVQGNPIPTLYYIGPMLKAKFWEATAVPELRQHAHNIARILLDK